MAIAAQKNSKTLPIVIAVLAIIVIAALGYFVFKTLNTKTSTSNSNGTSLDTSQLSSQDLQYVQYAPATAPVPTSTQVGRDDPFSPY